MPREIPFAERQTRMDALRNGLTGVSITGEKEPAHGLRLIVLAQCMRPTPSNI